MKIRQGFRFKTNIRTLGLEGNLRYLRDKTVSVPVGPPAGGKQEPVPDSIQPEQPLGTYGRGTPRHFRAGGGCQKTDI